MKRSFNIIRFRTFSVQETVTPIFDDNRKRCAFSIHADNSPAFFISNSPTFGGDTTWDLTVSPVGGGVAFFLGTGNRNEFMFRRKASCPQDALFGKTHPGSGPCEINTYEVTAEQVNP